MKNDFAETGNLQTLLSNVGESLDQFVRFEHPDAYQTKKQWLTKLDIPLPQKGIGIDRVTKELISHVFPNGSPVGNLAFPRLLPPVRLQPLLWRQPRPVLPHHKGTWVPPLIF